MTWVLILLVNGITQDLSRPMNYYRCQNAMIEYIKQHPEQRQNVRCDNRYREPVNKE